MPTRILILETPSFKPSAEFCPGAARADSKAFAGLAQQHHANDTNDTLFIIAPSELRYLSEFDSASKGPNSLTAVFLSKAEEAERMLPIVLALAADERSSGVKTCLTKGSTVFSEQFFNANQIGEKLDPCFQFARKQLPPSVAMSVWGSLQALLFLGLQNIPEQGEKGTGERVEVQLGADTNLLALTVRFDLAPERLAIIRSSPLLALPRFAAGLFEFRYLNDGNRLELNCLFFAANPPERAVEVLTFQKQTALEDKNIVQEYNFRTFTSLANNAPEEKRVVKGGFKKKFSDQVTKVKTNGTSATSSTTVISPTGGDDDFVKNLIAGKEENIDAMTSISGEKPAAPQTVVVSGSSTLGAKESVTIVKGASEAASPQAPSGDATQAAAPKEKSIQLLESKIISLEDSLKQRDELVTKLNKEIAEIKDPLKMGVISGIKDNQVDGLKTNIARLQAEVEESANREKELMAIVDKAVQMKDDAMKRLKELDVKLKASAGGKSSQVQMLEKQLEEQKRQNKEMGKRVAALVEQIQKAGMRPAA